jgi:hypothetical protein
MPGWWNRLGAKCDWYITAECGHCVIRHTDKAPKRIRCDGCEPEGSAESSA